MDKTAATRKILRCLALSKSANETEANTALRQAQLLMQRHGLQQADLDAATITEQTQRAGAKRTPPQWESRLAYTVACCFGCELLFQVGDKAGHWLYVGHGPQPEIAGYSFAVLSRKVRAARAAYIQGELSRCSVRVQRARADLFCDAWVQAVTQHVQAFALSDSERQVLQMHMNRRFPTLAPLVSRNRNQGRRLSSWHLRDLTAGATEGGAVRLSHGVSAASSPLLPAAL